MGREAAAGGDGVSKVVEVARRRACTNAGVTLAEVRLGEWQVQGLVRMWEASFSRCWGAPGASERGSQPGLARIAGRAGSSLGNVSLTRWKARPCSPSVEEGARKCHLASRGGDSIWEAENTPLGEDA